MNGHFSCRIVICDSEADYAAHLSESLRDRKVPYDIEVYYSAERLLHSCSRREDIVVLVIAESAYCEAVHDAGFPRVLILNESDRYLGADTCSISKYQSAETIAKAVMDACAEESGKRGNIQPSAVRHGPPMKIIGVYTPIARCLQTTVSLTAGQLLAAEHKTLYINFEPFSGLSAMLHRSFRENVSSLIYYNDCAREKIAGQIETMAESLNGLYFLPPITFFKDLQAIRRDQWLDLFHTIAQVTEFEYLILDLTESTDGLLDILRECDEVITIVRPSCWVSEAKMMQYRDILKARGYEDIYARTRKWHFPVFRELPADPAMLTHSELAAEVKHLLAGV
ncbi:MAG: hypothetical protein LKJ76_08810 [Lachnospiraceae bacterium]|nr:hypothetical protein [Lachnospiraceae bacterium]